LTNNLETQRELSSTLQSSVLGLESRVEAEQRIADGAKVRQTSLQEEISNVRAELTKKIAQLTEQEGLVQEKTLQLEAIQLETSASASEFAKSEEKWRESQERIREQVCFFKKYCSVLMAWRNVFTVIYTHSTICSASIQGDFFS